jgi:hypothetical protein
VTTLANARLRLEAAVLRSAYPGLSIAEDGTWVMIPHFRLPAGWVPDRTTVLIVPPPNYPECSPDGFYLTAQLRRHVAGQLAPPGHYFNGYHNPYAHLGWYWYCLQDPDRNWDPAQDTLLSFVEAIRTYLGMAD